MSARKIQSQRKFVKPSIWLGAPFDRPLVLLDEDVEIFGLADINSRPTIRIDRFERDETRPLVDGRRLGHAILLDRLLKVTPRCILVTKGALQKSMVFPPL
jgi:hypothetical protein